MIYFLKIKFCDIFSSSNHQYTCIFYQNLNKYINSKINVYLIVEKNTPPFLYGKWDCLEQMETWKKEECAIVGGGGTNQRASFMNFISHYSSFSYSYYFQHNFYCALFAWGLCLSVSPESKKRERERERETDGRREELREICREVIAQKER